MGTDTFRIGIVGTGMITQAAHLPAALASPRVVVEALVDPVLERASELADAFGVKPQLARSTAEVLGNIDGAIIATPNHTHCALALECIAAGVPVLIEKPLALDATEGRRIVEAAKEQGVTVAVGYMTRFFDSALLLERLLAEGYFGQVRRFAYQHGSPGGWAPLSAYNLSREQSGGGVLVVTGSHFVDRMLAWFGYPDAVEFGDDSLGGPEANCWARFRYDRDEGTIEGDLRLSKTFRMPGGMVLDTDRGRLYLAEPPEAPIRFRPAGRDDLEHSIVPRIGLETDRKAAAQVQLEDFVGACTQGRQPRVNATQALDSLRLIEALYACRQPLDNDVYDAMRVGGAR